MDALIGMLGVWIDIGCLDWDFGTWIAMLDAWIGIWGTWIESWGLGLGVGEDVACLSIADSGGWARAGLGPSGPGGRQQAANTRDECAMELYKRTQA